MSNLTLYCWRREFLFSNSSSHFPVPSFCGNFACICSKIHKEKGEKHAKRDKCTNKKKEGERERKKYIKKKIEQNIRTAEEFLISRAEPIFGRLNLTITTRENSTNSLFHEMLEAGCRSEVLFELLPQTA